MMLTDLAHNLFNDSKRDYQGSLFFFGLHQDITIKKQRKTHDLLRIQGLFVLFA